MNILALMPQEKFMHVCSVQSIMGFQADVLEKDKITFAFTAGHSIARARNMLIRHAINEEEYDYILWMDSDHIYDSKTLYKMIEADKDIISPKYNIRNSLGKELAVLRKTKDSWERYVDNVNTKGIKEVDAVGFGFLLMKASVAKAIYKIFPNPFKASDVSEEGEDIYFCERAKELGYKIYCDFDSKLPHVSVVTI